MAKRLCPGMSSSHVFTKFYLFTSLLGRFFLIEIKLWTINANLTVYVNKKDTLQPIKRKQSRFREKKILDL